MARLKFAITAACLLLATVAAFAESPDDEQHRLMHQRFVPLTVDVPAIPGYLVFQQSSVDGSDDPEALFRVGLLQFFVAETGQFR